MRLENIAYRLGFASTIPAARQLVNHGHLQVNGKKVNIPSFQCRPNDVISVKPKSQSISLVKASLETSVPVLPNNLILEKDKLTGKVTSLISREDVNLDVNELLIVEFYSRK